MSDFVHLHLHSEYSLLDGACRIEELLDRAVQLKMPAMAITEHGNMFSSIVFHDQARKRGIKPILGCEVYVAPGDRRTKSGTPGETANHLVLLAETNEGYHNLIKLVSSGYTEGFYYKPRIDKDLLARHAAGLIGLSSCLKGEVATGIRTEQQQKARSGGGRVPRHPRSEQLLPRDAVPGHRRAADRQRRAAADRQGSRSQPRRHQRRPLPAELRLQAARHPAVHRDRQDGERRGSAALSRRSVLPEDRRGDGGGLQGLPRGAAPTRVRIAERCNVDLSGTVNHLPNFDVPAGFTLDDYFEHVVREGFEQRLPRLQELAARGLLRHTVDEYERRLTYEIEMIKQMKYPGTS